MDKNYKIYVAGHNGMVGSALVRQLRAKGYENLVMRSHSQLDLLDAEAVEKFFETERPDVVILAAARVGGIQANIEKPAEFLFENLQMQNNVIHQAYLKGVKRFCFLGSSCVYPKKCQQPMKEEYLMTGPLEPTNEGYALAKIAGLRMVEFYHKQYGFDGFSVMPCNLYGTNDSYDPKHSHVMSAMVKKFIDAKDADKEEVTMWGTGKARREFMHVDDAAAGVIMMLESYTGHDFMNIGTGEDISIKDLAELVAAKTGYKGKLVWDTSKPDGMLLKRMDVTRMKEFGFEPKISLEEGIERTIAEYRELKGGAK